ncbi:coxsackievirus and adenovirus receptor homolog [Dunckerocampus dactyliophorus]|uniref:coxsackievirus and adenovirus receptor homolog n=1 Tax=Dunckerocampus dactyliophorus TaxID=161453 RepID=UPI002406CF88|nr:coxsackievirus and adenovirus receptor homolog [Dunckerocampus dactyliophorus]
MVWVLWSLVVMLSFCRADGDSSLQSVVGSTAFFDCRYTLSSADGYYNIKWLKLPSTPEHDNRTIISFTDGKLHTDLYPQMEGRVSFTSPDARNGDASIYIHDLRPSDTGTYVCSVRTSSKIFKQNMMLTVIEEMSNPVCNVEGKPAVGKDVTLKCRSQGTLQQYIWEKTSGNKVLPPKANVDTRKGDLLVKNITEDDFGHYLCTVKGLNSTKSCLVLLKNPLAPPGDEVESTGALSPLAPSNGDPATAAAVTTVMLLLAIVCVVVGIWYWRRRSRTYAPNEIEVAAHPKSERANTLTQPSNTGNLFYDQVDAL